MSLTFTDIFCGAGGSSIGLSAAGFTLKLAANHWQTAIDTHAANFRQAEHLCADVNNYDMRRLPRTDLLWASPICTEASPASGTSGRRRPKGAIAGQLDVLEAFGHVPKAGMERTRATFHDVIRATEVHRYLAVIVENVPDVVERWELFDWWVDGMRRLGYHAQLVSASSAHIGGHGNPHAPQWRDRLYIVFTRTGVPAPDLAVRPLALCEHCGTDVTGVQTWAPSTDRRAYQVGRYRRNPTSNYGQYWFTCPEPRCGHRVEPYVLPAASALDMSDLGQRIGDMRRPPAANTLRRVAAGLSMFTQPADAHDAFYVKNFGGYASRRNLVKPITEPFGTVTTTDHHSLVVTPFMGNANHDDDRLYPAASRPLSARTTKIGDWVCNPILVPSGGNWADKPTDALGEPMRTRTANPKGFETVVTPEPFLAVLRRNGTATSVSEPMATVTAGGNHHALVVPYYSTGTARPSENPSTRSPLVTGSPSPPPTARRSRSRTAGSGWSNPAKACAQRFDDTYLVTGNKGEQTMQAGNAVSANVAQWIGQRLAAALGAAA
jgi:DNA (cytosine-5)-methyltransferase 1